ncbi:MAG: hypothetical protein ACPKPY_02900 [Nitrososphaeraceae archaeon]
MFSFIQIDASIIFKKNLSLLVVISSCFIPSLTFQVFAQQEEIFSTDDYLELQKAIKYMGDLGDFSDLCSKVVKFDTSYIQSCMKFIKDFNQHMKIVFDNNNDIVTKLLR